MNLNILKNKVGWFGKYSGYECLIEYYSENIKYQVHISKSTFFNKVFGKVYQLINNWHFISPDQIHAGIKFFNDIKSSSVSHMLYVEPNVYLLNTVKVADKKLIATIHIPIRQWKESNLLLLSKLNNVIILYKEELSDFSKYIDLSKIHIIKHGVDINFFKPGVLNQINKNKILFVGHYLRNFDMFLKVYNELNDKVANDIEVHFIIPSDFRKNISVLDELAQKDNVFFHEKLSDEELLQQYQTSYLLVMPMEDSGANTAIIQSIAVGLPVITTDVGGIRSYGGGDIFPVIPNNDHEQMIELIRRYYNDLEYRNNISKNIREYAINTLDWNLVAKQHVDLYRKIENQ